MVLCGGGAAGSLDGSTGHRAAVASSISTRQTVSRGDPLAYRGCFDPVAVLELALRHFYKSLL